MRIIVAIVAGNITILTLFISLIKLINLLKTVNEFDIVALVYKYQSGICHIPWNKNGL